MGVQIKGAVIGDISGKVGNVVLSKWKGLRIAKSRPGRISKRMITKEQIEERELFSVVMKFLRTLDPGKEIFKKGFQLKTGEHLTAINAAVSWHLHHAVEGEYPDYRIDLSQLKFSRSLRSTENGFRLKISGLEGRVIDISWELNSYREKTTQLDDRAVVVYYWVSLDDGNGTTILDEGTQRSELHTTFKLPHSLIGAEVHFYIYFTSADGKLVSETEYLGMFNGIA